MMFKPVAESADACATLIPARGSTAIVHCRTGHRASRHVEVRIQLHVRNLSVPVHSPSLLLTDAR